MSSILLGGRTGAVMVWAVLRFFKAHKLDSLEHCGAEVQEGQCYRRKLQRLFRREDACRMIKRCNDFGAGGVSIAIGELADGLYIDLNKVTKKYEGRTAFELAISEPGAWLWRWPRGRGQVHYLANEGNEATPVAKVTTEPA